MPTFQGSPLTHEAAEKVLRGWLGELPSSWLVAAGKNPAYDFFPCQHQLFFPGRARGAYWSVPFCPVTPAAFLLYLVTSWLCLNTLGAE